VGGGKGFDQSVLDPFVNGGLYRMRKTEGFRKRHNAATWGGSTKKKKAPAALPGPLGKTKVKQKRKSGGGTGGGFTT